MKPSRSQRIAPLLPVLVIFLLPRVGSAVEFAGGTGDPNAPYQIATAQQLIGLGKDPNLYDKHFILTADIDLDPNLPGRKRFDTAVIAPSAWSPFSGVFDGNEHAITRLSITGAGYLGMFGQLGPGSEISNLGLEAIDVNGIGNHVGGLVGHNRRGTITSSYSTGSVSGTHYNVGGLVGYNEGSITSSYSAALVSGRNLVGGLVGDNEGSITSSCSAGTVTGRRRVGGLVGRGSGSITLSYSTGSVTGTDYCVGGLVGDNWGSITSSFSTGSVTGDERVGGLVGYQEGSITLSCSTGSVTGGNFVGGLVGHSEYGRITTSYSTGSATGGNLVGGLLGHNDNGSITTSYSTGSVSGHGNVGGLVGYSNGSVTTSFWDIETSGQTGSNGGIGLTTIEMKAPEMLALNGLAHNSNWVLHAGQDYPRLAWEGTFGQAIPDPVIDWLSGSGTPEAPFEIFSVEQLVLLSKASILADKYFVLRDDLDLSELTWNQAVIPYFDGRFDGNGYIISHLAIQGGGLLGLFGRLGSSAEVMNLGLEAVNVNGTDGRVGSLVGENDGSITLSYGTGSVIGGNSVGGLVGENGGSITSSYGTSSVSGGDRDVGGLVGYNEGSVTSSYSTGSVRGRNLVGGLVGHGSGSITLSYSTGKVSGNDRVGGLVGYSRYGSIITTSYSASSVSGDERIGGLVGHNGSGSITSSYNTGTVSGGNNVGGLVGDNSSGSITASYNTGTVTGGNSVGGLVGDNSSGSVTASYSTGSVTGGNLVGGLVGHNDYGSITTSFWDIETSGQAGSNGGVGLTTIEMKDPEMLALNGLAHDSNWVLHAGHDYPRLAWEGTFGQTIPDPVIDWLSGSGTPEAPFEISSVEQLILLSKASILADKYFVLCNHLDLSELTWNQAVIPYFDGTFDGNDYAISHLAIQGGGLLGLFGRLGSNAEVMSLGVEAVEINGTDGRVGGLVGQNDGSITSSYSAGSVSGGNSVGGLVGENGGSITTSYGTSSVSGANDVGGLAGYNWGTITTSRSTGTVIGEKNVGGLVGRSDPNTGITACWSTGTVTGDANVGGLVGVSNSWEFARSYSTATVIGVEAVGGLVGRNDSKGRITTSWSTGTVSGGTNVGGFAGENHNSVAASYSTVAVTGDGVVGGLVGLNANGSTLNHCYSAGSVSGRYYVGGLVGDNDGDVTGCFWDTDSSAQLMMCGSQGDEATGCDDSFGRTTAELRIARTFLDAGWDFANEKDNGGQDIWWILEGEDYSRLVCQLWASVPVPHNGAIVVSQSAILSWQGAPGTEAHDVYLGEDEQAVANATAQSTGIYRGRQQAHETTYAPEILKVDATYYWRIDEVNEIDPNSPHKGWIWSFTTGDSNVLVVDDFESYNNDSPNYPFQTWLDAWGYSADEFFPDGYEGNGTGGALGYDIWTWQAPYIMETEIVHGGEQSVPYYYDNSRWLYYSEVQRTFTRPSYCGEDRVETPQNWTVDDADTLILHFHGKPDNDPEPLYVAIEDSTGQIARVTHPGSDAVLATEWQQWQIPLADFQAQGVDVTSVRKMIIGLGNRDAPQPGGSGLIYIDDIWVTKRMP